VSAKKEAANLVTLPEPAESTSGRQHAWNAIPIKFLSAVDEHGNRQFPDGNARTLRTCSQCDMVKVTVHPPHGNAWREWRTKDGKVWVGELTPPCLTEEKTNA